MTAVLAAAATVMAAILALVGVMVGQLYGRISTLEKEITELWDARRADAVVIRRLGDHIDVLEDHIWKRLPPPPPQRPDGI